MEVNRKLLLYYGEMESPIGPLTLFASDYGLCALQFAKNEEAMVKFKRNHHFAMCEYEHRPEAVQDAIEQLNQYFQGTRTTFQLPLDLRGTPFQLKVWKELQQIPYGETASYKKIAELIGRPKAIRAVGAANNQNPLPIIVPCHRVVGSNGALVGYGGGLERKEYLLNLESRLAKKHTS